MKYNFGVNLYHITDTIGWCILFAPAWLLAQNAIPTTPLNLPVEYAVISPLATQSLLLDGIIIDKQLIVVGDRGHILTSNMADNNKPLNLTWTQAKTPTQVMLTGVYFHTAQLGWAVGHDAIILRTRNGARHWERIYNNPQDERPLLDVWFKDAQQGFAIGAYGLFLETTNGGDTWSMRQIIEEDFHFNHITQANNGKLFIAAEAGNVYRSDDQGQTWQSLPSPYHGSFFGTLPLDGDTLLLYGLRGQLFRSEDNGEQWHKITTDIEASLTAGRYLNNKTVVIVGLGGTVLISHDQGRHFTLHQQRDRKGISQALAIDNAHIILVGEAGIKPLVLPSSSPTHVP